MNNLSFFSDTHFLASQPSITFDLSGVTDQERDNARLYDYECRRLAHEQDKRLAQVEAWKQNEEDALDEAFAVACVLPCSLTEARRRQADTSEGGVALWAGYVQDVKTARLIDNPAPVLVVNYPSDYLEEAEDGAEQAAPVETPRAWRLGQTVCWGIAWLGLFLGLLVYVLGWYGLF